MKSKRSTPQKNNVIAAALIRRMTKDCDCPYYDGVGEIPESESPYVIVLARNGRFAFRVRREMVEGGIPEDPDALFDDALIDALEAPDEPSGPEQTDEDSITDDWDEDDLWILRPSPHVSRPPTNDTLNP